MNTLTGIEAERVNQILRHAIERLQILSYIPLIWDEELVVDLQCPPVLNALERLWMAEEQLNEEHEASLTDMMGMGGGKDILLLKQQHRACRVVCRNLLADRESLQSIMVDRHKSIKGPETAQQHQHSADFAKFIRYLQELRGQVMQRLTTTVEDEAAARATLHELTEKERLYEESRDVLQNKLNELREEKDTVSHGLDNTIRKLRNELHDISQHNSFEMESVQKEMNEAINKATADHESRMRHLQDRVDAMERSVAESVTKNREEEQRMRKEKTRIEATLNAKVAQYDEDMSIRQKTLMELNQAFEVEQQDYALLKEHFEKIDADISRNVEEEQILSAAQRREDFGLFIMNTFAANIQKIYRGRVAREAVAKLKAKQKKGKKGKKGKK